MALTVAMTSALREAEALLIERLGQVTLAEIAEDFEARLSGADGKKVTRLDVGTAAEAEAFLRAGAATRAEAALPPR